MSYQSDSNKLKSSFKSYDKLINRITEYLLKVILQYDKL